MQFMETESTSTLATRTGQRLRCPICRSRLSDADGQLVCTNGLCNGRFPVIDGVPILINDAASVFAITDFLNARPEEPTPPSIVKRIFYRLLPEIGRNLSAKQNYDALAALLLRHALKPQVLVVGGRIAGKGMEQILANPEIEFIETDVAFGPRTTVICDAHDLPFEDGTFDGVIVQAVLEHVADPYRSVAEIHRVLNDGGLIYAEVPFMQQVHGGPYDFTRFTSLGLRRLFRHFDEISRGMAGGPGMALAWSYQYFLYSFAHSTKARSLFYALGSVTGFWLKYFDTRLAKRPAALDAASGTYFLGRKSQEPISDRDLIELYRGGMSPSSAGH